MSEELMNMISKWSQNLSKIDPGGALEATWEPPLKQSASKMVRRRLRGAKMRQVGP